MAKFYVVNAFSLNMLPVSGIDLALRPISTEGVKNLLANEDWQSAIGHQSTADLLTAILGVEIDANRTTLQFSLHDSWSLIVAQYTGPRLDEGVTELPAGAALNFWQVYEI